MGLQMLRLRFGIALVLVSMSLYADEKLPGKEKTCDFGEQLRLFDSGKHAQKSEDREKLLISLLGEPLFLRDEEKYVEALLQLRQFPKSNEAALQKIRSFLTKSVNPLSLSIGRERRANALLNIYSSAEDAIKSSVREQARKILLTKLAETNAARQLKSDLLSDSDWLQRLEVLNERNENLLIIEETGLRKKALSKQNLYSCRVRFLFGKALRKNRNYQEAIDILDEVSEKCDGDDARDAAFLLTRLAAITPSPTNLKYFESFQKKYAAHSYFDDTLIFKASALESLGKAEAAKDTLLAITKLKGSCDMRFEAFFRLAFMYAMEGNSKEAVNILQNSLADPVSQQMSLIEKHRAIYWSVRLKLFENIFDQQNVKLGALGSEKERLQSIVDSGQTTFYSWLAAGILDKTGNRKPNERAPQNINPAKGRQVEIAPIFETVFCLVQHGYEQYAKRFIELLEPLEVKDEERIEIARKLSKYGLYNDAYRFANSSVAATEQERMQLLYPKAYEETVKEAAEKVGISRDLVFGLMREESRFDARAVSWAGARGLLQLMPAVANIEARKFKMGELSQEDMLDPKINILLGAEHLKGMRDGLKHPLLAIAAYNAGFARVKSWTEKFQKIRALDTFVENIPLPETRNYVKRVTASWLNYSLLYSSNDTSLKDVSSSAFIN